MSDLTLRERYEAAAAAAPSDEAVATIIEYAERESAMVIALATVCADACEPPDYRPRDRNEWIAWAIDNAPRYAARKGGAR